MDKPKLYNLQVANEFEVFAEIIDGVCDTYEGLRWAAHSYEFGIYFRDKESKNEFFLGIWFDAWKHFEMPICIRINYKGKAPFEKHRKIQSFIEGRKEEGVLFKDYQDFAVVLFDYSFFKFDETDAAKVGELYNDVITYTTKENVQEEVKP